MAELSREEQRRNKLARRKRAEEELQVATEAANGSKFLFYQENEGR
jgi:hypothetical protein